MEKRVQPTIICSIQVTLYRISTCSTSYCKSYMWLIKFSNYYFWQWSRNIKKKLSDFNQQDICTSSYEISIKEYLKQVLPKAVTSKIRQTWKFPWQILLKKKNFHVKCVEIWDKYRFMLPIICLVHGLIPLSEKQIILLQLPQSLIWGSCCLIANF